MNQAQEVAAYMRLLAAVLHLGNLVISNPQTDWPKTEEEKQEKGQDVEVGRCKHDMQQQICGGV